MKNILIVGVLDKPGSTNISMAKSIKRFGFNPIPLNYRTILGNYGPDFFKELILEVVDEYRPVLVIFCKCNGIDTNIVKKVSEKTMTFLWNPDPTETIKNCPEVLEHAKNSHFSSCTGGGVVDWFKEQGVENCFHVYDGVDYDIFKPTRIYSEYSSDISFIGSRTPERDKYISCIKDAGYDIKCYGRGYVKEVINENFAKVCSSSKMMLSLNTYNDIHSYFSNRLVRYMGCGSCVLHLDTHNSLDKNIFKNSVNIVRFTNEKTLLSQIKNNINNPEKMSNIGLNALDTVLKNFTWDHTVQKIFTILQENAK